MNLKLSAAIAALFLSAAAQAQTQGVSKTEILVGTIQDLSGPIAAYGKSVRNGLQMRLDEANESGGVNGRKFKMLVEDDGYDPKKALLAAQKLVQSDKIFVMLGHLGTAPNMASMPIQFEKNVPNLFPVTAAREMYEPLNKLTFASFAPYYDQVRTAIPVMMQKKKYAKVCINYQDDDFGLEVLRGTESGLKSMGMQLAEKASFKRGATDFSSQVARLKSAGCDLVVLGTIIRETVGTIAEARKTGFNADFLGTSASYTHLIHVLGGKAVEGFYSAHTVGHPYPDDASKSVRDWSAAYKKKAGEDANLFSVYGYELADLFVKATDKAGPNLTVESLVGAMESMSFPRDMFGAPPMTFSKTKHIGSVQSRISVIANGKWTPITDYANPPSEK